ncbi:hypothetical protein [Rhodosalinus sp. K401]|uniref:hypothetical protein n=1 Tax=Rhodosalinus sp. K401 TaxID=3239195 RepID=UPI0035268337
MSASRVEVPERIRARPFLPDAPEEESAGLKTLHAVPVRHVRHGRGIDPGETGDALPGTFRTNCRGSSSS